MTRHSQLRTAVCTAAGAALVLGFLTTPAGALTQPPGVPDVPDPPQPQPEELVDVSQFPWGDTSLSPEQRASLLIDAMSEDEKIEQLSMELDNANRYNYDENVPRDPEGNEIGNRDLPGCEWYDI